MGAGTCREDTGAKPEELRGRSRTKRVERERCLSTHDEAQVAWPQPAQTRNRGKAKRSRFLINTR